MGDLGAIREILAKHKSELQRRFHVAEIGIFGSYVHGKEEEGSDVDILVEFAEPIGWEFVELKEYLESLLGKSVDLVTVNTLKPQLKEKILAEVEYT